MGIVALKKQDLPYYTYGDYVLGNWKLSWNPTHAPIVLPICLMEDKMAELIK